MAVTPANRYFPARDGTSHHGGMRTNSSGRGGLPRWAVVLSLVLIFVAPAVASAHDRELRWKPIPTGSDQQYRASGPAGAVAILR